MTNEKPLIAIGADSPEWADRFTDALAKKAQGLDIEYQTVDLQSPDWLEAVAPFNVVIWKPMYMGPQSAAQFISKIHILEKLLGKLVIPNFSTIWHFESKIDQSFLFEIHGIPTPRTVVCFDYHEALKRLREEQFPLVFKESFGAASRNVRLVKDLKSAKSAIADIFHQQLWDECKEATGSTARTALAAARGGWLLAHAMGKIKEEESYRSVYWQEFVPGNDADLRITVIGSDRAFGFWRRNRPNDFRASGSGRIDYETPVPEDAVRYCMKLNQGLDFDSMAYDLLFTPNGFIINEISYGYLASAIYNTPGYYQLLDDGRLQFVEGHTWPQELWVDWALRRAGLV